MKIPKNIAILLGLSRKELRILEILSETPLLTSDIKRTVRIPRATLDRALIKLHKRGLVSKHKYSARRGGWVSSDLENILKEESTPQSAFKMKHYIGLEKMKEVEYDFMGSYKNTKCYGVQSTRAWRAWHTRLSKETAADLNNLLAKNNILMDIILTKEVDKELLKVAYKDRPSLAHVVPEKFLPTAFDIEVTNKEVFIMNWERLRGISIQDEEVALLFQKLIEYIKESSEYYNVHKVIAMVND